MRNGRLRAFLTSAAVGFFCVVAAPVFAEQNVLRVVIESDPPSLDPTQSTSAVVTYFADLVYEPLFAYDSKGSVQPQLVQNYTVSEDHLKYTFTLRDGATFHDGKPVKSADVIASLERFFSKDSSGSELKKRIKALQTSDDKSFTMTLSEPYGFVLDVLAKRTPTIPYIYPAWTIAAGTGVPISDHIGSGPYIYDPQASRPGSVLTLRRNPQYAGRAEPQDLLAGSRKGGSDVIELHSMPDSQTAANALTAGEVDFISDLDPDLVEQLQTTPGIVVGPFDPRSGTILLRFNSLTPPFNDARARRAVAMVTDQSQYFPLVTARPEDGKECKSIFTCDSPYTNFVGSDVIGNMDVDAAKKLVKESGYDGTPIVVLQPTDVPNLKAIALVAAQQLRSIGFNVEVAASDWATLIQRRALKVPQSEGGWNLFVTTATADQLDSPLNSLPANMNCETSWAGWPCDKVAEDIKSAFEKATSVDERKKLAADFQARILEVMPYVPAGQFVSLSAWSDKLQSIAKGPGAPFYGIVKKAD